MGIEGGGIELEKEEIKGKERSRKSKDGKVNREGSLLINFVEERGWGILNGSIEGDEGGEYIFTGGRGNSVIDYMIGNEEIRGKDFCNRMWRGKARGLEGEYNSVNSKKGRGGKGGGL